MSETSLQGFQKAQRRKVLDKHREVLRLVCLGQSDATIAYQLGLTPATVGNIRRSDEGKRILSTLQSSRDSSTLDIQKRIQELTPAAMDVVEDAIKSDSGNGTACLLAPKDRAKLALEVLDRAGHSTKHQHEVNHRGGVANYHLLANLDKRAEEEEVMEAELIENAS